MITLMKLIIRDIFYNKYKFIILLFLNIMLVNFFAQAILIIDIGSQKINGTNKLKSSNIYSVNLFNTVDNIDLFQSDELNDLISDNHLYLSSNGGVGIKNNDNIMVMMLVANTIKVDGNVYEGKNTYIGSNIKKLDVGDSFSLNSFPELLEFNIDERLDPNSLMISGNQIVDLNEYIVIVVDLDYFIEKLNLIYGQDYSINYFSDDIGVREIVESIGGDNIISHIDDPLQATNNYYTIILQRNIQYMIVSIIMLVLGAVAISVSIHQITKNNINEYMIHHLFGSSKIMIYIRTISFGLLISIISYIPAIYNWAKQSIYIKTDIIIACLTIMFILSVLAICLTPIKYLKNQELTAFLKKEID